MNDPVTTERKSFLPLRLRSTTVLGSNSIPTVSRPTTPVTTPTSLAVQNDPKSSLIVGNRVLVNGLKSGTLCYIGSVQFAQGLFCGVELDEPEGKHDGQVNEIRYFQCKTNHGIFVPRDKVVLAARERAYTMQRSMSRLKPPLTRSMTISSAGNNKIEQIPNKISPKTVQLPDIIPTPSTPTPSVSIIEPTNDPIITDIHEILTPTDNSASILRSQPTTIDEAPETIEADFTDSVSLILHQLQQEPEPFIRLTRSSIAISEEGTIDDDVDDTDESDNESVSEPILSEKVLLSLNDNLTKSIQTDLSYNVHENITMMKNNLLNSKSLSYSNKSLSSSTTSINKLKINATENKRKPNLPTPAPVVKKASERKLSVPLTNPLTIARKLSVPLTNPLTTARKLSIPLTNTSRRSSMVPPKKDLLSSTKSVTSFGSQSKLNQSLSSSNSVSSSRSDLTSNQRKSSKITSKPAAGATRPTSHSIDLGSNKKTNQTSDVLDHQSMIQKAVIQSLESTNEHLKKQMQHLVQQFDLMCILSQYYISQNEQIEREYALKLAKVRKANDQLKTSVKQLQLSDKNELISINEQNQLQLQSLQELHQQQSIQYQQEIDQLSKEKTSLETRCTSLQEEVDRFMSEMANSEHADPLLRRVEILEKDRTSLETVLELRNQELTQLRTRINEQVFQREDQLVLQKRIDMAENRNEDLVCLLRNWQLNEKVVTIERDELKEQLAQLERDKRQLIFENETLLYSLRQRSTTISCATTSELMTNSRPIQKLRNRTQSFSIITIPKSENRQLKRSLSLHCIWHR